jgi:hypothetical protein
MIKLSMQNLVTDYNKTYKTSIIRSQKFNSKSKTVDINKLLNRVKKKATEEKKKKLTILFLAIAPICIIGLIVF